MALVLASASPRRADLLRAAGFLFDVRPVDVDERRLTDEAPAAYVLRVALAKAEAAAARSPGNIVLAADTTVAVANLDDDAGSRPPVVLGKPADEADATRMLRLLSGRVHEVLTGVVITFGDRAFQCVEVTRVWFAPLTETDIAWYVGSGEPLDKAGGYAIQGRASRFVQRIDGSYSNVVGLPVARVSEALGALEPGA